MKNKKKNNNSAPLQNCWDRFSLSGFQSQAVAGLQEGQRHPPVLAGADAATAADRILGSGNSQPFRS